MYVHNLNPTLLSLGPLSIRYYSIPYILGLLIAYYLIWWAFKNKRIKGLTEENAEELMLYLAIGLIAGARILYFVFYNLSGFFANPLELFYVWHGGMSFHGGFIGLAIAVWLFMRKHNVSFLSVADLITLPGAIGLTLGRIGNFINGEVIGTVTTSNWCVTYPGIEGCRHFWQFYASGANFIMFWILFFMYKSKKFATGIVFWTFVLLYGFHRTVLSFWRDDPNVLGPLGTGQLLSLVMIIIAVYALVVRYKERRFFTG